MTELPVTTAATFCATVVDEWVRGGVTDAVVAPGSRSTPLALALAADDRIQVHIHHDERSAAFMALGLGLATGRPAPVLTTSGTATVELHPAVVEAHHSRVPMICCTADRPPELHHVGAPQTIDQTRLYGAATRWFVDPGVPDEAARSSWRSLASRALAEAVGPPGGPVQINLPFRDPLVGRPGELPAPGRAPGPWHTRFAGHAQPAESVLNTMVETVTGSRGVIVAGPSTAGEGLNPEAVHKLAVMLGWPVLADPRSGCRTPTPTTVAHADALLRDPDFAQAHRPEVVLQLGSPPASKVVGQWLAGSGATHLVVDPDGWWFDPDRQATFVVAAEPSLLAVELVALLAPRGPAPADWAQRWHAADQAAAGAIDEVLARHPEATEPATARQLLAGLPTGAALVVASSMPVRDVEWYGAGRGCVRVLSNRGANGIDGVVSTAVGVALTGAPTALLIGDVALLHDSNGLLGLAERGVDLVIVAVDNGGGGIFSFLPPAQLVAPEQFERLFGTPHGVDLAALAAVHRISATTLDRQSEFAARVDHAFGAGGVHLIVVRTNRAENVAVHDEIHAAVAAAVTQEMS